MEERLVGPPDGSGVGQPCRERGHDARVDTRCGAGPGADGRWQVEGGSAFDCGGGLGPGRWGRRRCQRRHQRWGLLPRHPHAAHSAPASEGTTGQRPPLPAPRRTRRRQGGHPDAAPSLGPSGFCRRQAGASPDGSEGEAREGAGGTQVPGEGKVRGHGGADEAGAPDE